MRKLQTKKIWCRFAFVNRISTCIVLPYRTKDLLPSIRALKVLLTQRFIKCPTCTIIKLKDWHLTLYIQTLVVKAILIIDPVGVLLPSPIIPCSVKSPPVVPILVVTIAIVSIHIITIFIKAIPV